VTLRRRDACRTASPTTQALLGPSVRLATLNRTEGGFGLNLNRDLQFDTANMSAQQAEGK
jgi:hypothetical protein